MRPYYYIHNQASSITIPTDPVTAGTVGESNPSGYTGTDMPIGGYKVTSDNGAVATNTSDDSGAGSNF
ncbi:hypothetical protein [Bacilli bacterium]|jgi:hypothetical protein|uniref:hypothetical protein n=1 Tax=Intestinibacter bartlettii TaxID=261299 RepID=UPI0015A9BFA6|nr:MAG TPA: hypothetical protein [Bacteriophage sp.]DAT29112.1 MAG TPA: hypothetical protein [Caudoviricetes sp.]